MLTTKELIKLNNEKRELLTPENKEYYEHLLVYIRLNLFKDERATEEVLFEMLDHLLEAQEEGKSAEEVFGKTPKELADEITQSLPKESKNSLIEFVFEILMTFLGWALIPVGIFTFFKDKAIDVHLVSLLIYAILYIAFFVIALYVAFKSIKKNAFDDKKQKRASWIYGLTVAILMFVLFLSCKMIGSFGPKIEVSYYTILGLGCFFILASYLMKKIRESK